MKRSIPCGCGEPIEAHWQIFDHRTCHTSPDMAPLAQAQQETWRLEKLRRHARRQLERLHQGKMSKIEAFRYGKHLESQLYGRVDRT
jgi:hypothetical protein